MLKYLVVYSQQNTAFIATTTTATTRLLKRLLDKSTWLASCLSHEPEKSRLMLSVRVTQLLIFQSCAHQNRQLKKLGKANLRS